MKKAVGLFVLLFSLSLFQPAQANSDKSIAIIDTAIDSSDAIIKNNLVYEVCIMDELRCPNRKDFQEGPGSATLPASQLYKNGFDHGTVMSKVAIMSNPNIKLVFIRIVPMTSSGRQSVYTDSALSKALEWVAENKTKFNIVSVSASMGNNNFQRGYCVTNPALKNAVIKLQSMNIPSIFAAGNRYDYSRIDYPACVSEAVAISSVDRTGSISRYTNLSPETDFFVLGTYSINGRNAIGTSGAAAAFSAYWAKVYNGSYSQTYDYIKSITKPAVGDKVKTNLFVDITK